MKKITGLGLVLLSSDGRIFTIKELRDKPEYHKYSGMISIPLETVKVSDEGLYGTMRRLVSEETGIPLKKIKLEKIFSEKFNPIVGRPDIDVFYGYGIFLGKTEKEYPYKPRDKDIEFFGWINPNVLRSCYRRIEVDLILSHFYKQCKQKLF